MCGILFTHNHKARSTKHIKDMFNAQSERGIDGFGAVLVNGSRITDVHRATDKKGIFKKLKHKHSNMCLFHHRYPTSTPNLVESTHPMKIQLANTAHRYYIIHNGVISNHRELYQAHKTEGIEYKSHIREHTTYVTAGGTEYYTEESEKYNDSEALAYDLAKVFEGQQELVKARGSIAFIALQTDLKNNVLRVLFGRNDDSPMYMYRSNKSLVLASTFKAVQKLSTTDIKIVDTDTLYSYDVRDGSITEVPLELNGTKYSYYGSYSGYGDYGSSTKYEPKKTKKDSKTDEYELKADMYDELWELFDAGMTKEEVAADIDKRMAAIEDEMYDVYENSGPYETDFGEYYDLSQQKQLLDEAHQMYLSLTLTS